MAEVTIPEEVLKMHLHVSFDMRTGQMSVEGCDKNPIVALGMLDYALARVRRFLTTGDIAQEIQDAQRIVRPQGPLI
jgi:hypothetical protein